MNSGARRQLSVRAKLRLAMLGTAVAALTLAFASFASFVWITARLDLERELASTADVVGINAIGALSFNDPHAARETLSGLRADPWIVSARVFDRDGALFAAYSRDARGDGNRVRPSAAGTADRTPAPELVVSRPIVLRSEEIGRIELDGDMRLARARIRRGVSAGVAILAASIALTVVLSARLAQVISRPLRQLADIAVRVAEDGDYSRRATGGGSDELGVLIERFNHMLAQIEDRERALSIAREELEERVRDRTRKLQIEVDSRTRVEHELRAALSEQEVMLKEIHHRVKNNLQVISSLLRLQASHITNPQARQALETSQYRVRSIAMVHEMFYQSEALTRIELAPFLRALSSHILSAYASDPERIRLEHRYSPVSVELETAIPVGLIVHELVSNAIKYAFPSGRGGTVTLDLRSDQHTVHLGVSDDGVGIPAPDPLDSPTTLGLVLVRNLAQQLDGEIEVAVDDGTRFSIRFPIPDARR